MENKYLVALIVSVLTILVGLALFTPIGVNIGRLAVIQTSTNLTFTLPANATTSDFIPCGQQNTSAVGIYDPAGVNLIPYGNYTVAQGTGVDGYLASRITLVNVNTTYASANVNVSCSYQPRGYITDGGSRAMALLIPIFFALLIAVAALPQGRDWIRSTFKK